MNPAHSYIFETQNYIIFIQPKNILLSKHIKFELTFCEENQEVQLKKISSEKKEGWKEIIYLYFFHKNTKKQHIIYIGSSSKNEIKKKIQLKEKKVFVCLSTIPSRANNVAILKNNLEYLLKTQTEAIEKIYISIPKKYLRFKETVNPTIIQQLEKYDNIEIIYLEKDYGPCSKYMGPLIHKYEELKNNIMIVIDDDRKYNKYLVQHFKIAHASFPDTKFLSGEWNLFFQPYYNKIREEELDMYKIQENTNTKIKRGAGLGGFYGFAIIVQESMKEFLDYHFQIIENVKNAKFHDEGISLGYIKFKEEPILYLKHKGCSTIFLEPDALWKETKYNRKKIENDILKYTQENHLLNNKVLE
jgi:hypothetical protein